MNLNSLKKMRGQFFTISNPFMNDLFFKWMKKIENFNKEVLLEPFAGNNNIVDFIMGMMIDNKWVCYDIDDNIIQNTVDHEYPVIKRDVLKDFPKGFKIAITNPPYLAKNSATRNGLEYPDTKYDDLYKYCLEVMLDNVDNVAAILPESFLTQNLFHKRLYGVISLTSKMFDDTDCPVCLALFLNDNLEKDNFLVYSGDTNIGTYQDLKQFLKTLMILNLYF